MNERQQAWYIANRWLDGRMNSLVDMVPGDPDCDACVLARQYMRALDKIAQLTETERLSPTKLSEHPMTERRQPQVGWVCPTCGQARGPDRQDPCIKNLPGVTFACCGHGGHGMNEAYICFENGVRIGMVVTSISYDDDRPSVIVDLAPPAKDGEIGIATRKDPIRPTVEAIESMQRNIDYWGQRCERAEREIKRLLDLAPAERATKEG